MPPKGRRKNPNNKRGPRGPYKKKEVYIRGASVPNIRGGG